jgi:hypothetical protein
MRKNISRTISNNICLIIIILTGSLCSTISTNDKKEGLVKENIFRVYVRIDSFEIKDTMTDSEVNKYLVDKGKKRYEEIWNGLISLNKNNISKEVQDSVFKSKNRASLNYRKEREEYIEAYIDFKIDNDVKELYHHLLPPVISDKDGDDD